MMSWCPVSVPLLSTTAFPSGSMGVGFFGVLKKAKQQRTGKEFGDIGDTR